MARIGVQTVCIMDSSLNHVWVEFQLGDWTESRQGCRLIPIQTAVGTCPDIIMDSIRIGVKTESGQGSAPCPITVWTGVQTEFRQGFGP